MRALSVLSTDWFPENIEIAVKKWHQRISNDRGNWQRLYFNHSVATIDLNFIFHLSEFIQTEH